MNAVGAKEYDAIFNTIEQKTIDLDEHLAKERTLFDSEFKKKAENAKAVAEKECQHIVTTTEKKIDEYAKDARKQSLMATKKALQSLIDMLSVTEQMALEAKKKARQNALQSTVQKLEGEIAPKPMKLKKISYDARTFSGWKKKLFMAFECDVKYLEKIVMCGEDEAQAKDFLTLFSVQKAWFAKKLHKVEDHADRRFCVLLEKKRIFSALVHAQKLVQKELEKKVSLIKPEKKPTIARLRLLALYEVNSFVQEKVAHMGMIHGDIVFADYEISDLVESILATLDATYKPSFYTRVPKTMETVVPERTKLIGAVEATTKDNLDLTTVIMKHDDQMKKLSQDMEEIKTDIVKEKGLRREAQERAAIVDELGEKRVSEYKKEMKK